MSNSYVSLLIRSSGPSKAGVVKRGCLYDTIIITRKAITVLILITKVGIEMVKYSQCQDRSRPYIVNPKNPSSYSSYIKDKKSYDSVGLTVESTVRLSRQIRKAEVARALVETIRKLQLRVLLEAESAFDRAKASEDLLKRRRFKLVRKGLDSLEANPDDLSGVLVPKPSSLSEEVLT